MSYYPPPGDPQSPEPQYPVYRDPGAEAQFPYSPQHPAPPPHGMWSAGPQAPPPPRNSRKRYWWFAVPIAAIAAVGIGAGVAQLGGNSSSAPPSPESSISNQSGETTEAPPPPPPTIYTQSYRTPTAADFSVSLKILSKQCFGSAGCNLTFRLQLTLLVPTDTFDPSKTIEITYQIDGDEDGPIVDTTDLTDGKYDANQGIASTPTSGTTLHIKITNVEEI